MKVATRFTMATALVVALASLSYAFFDLRSRRFERGAGLEAGAGTAGERAVRVRIGVHTGEVVEQDGDLFGQAVHAAARDLSTIHGEPRLLEEGHAGSGVAAEEDRAASGIGP